MMERRPGCETNCALVVSKMSRLEKDIEFTYGNRINWYMFFFAIVAGKAAEKYGWGDKDEVNYGLMVDEIFQKFKLNVFDRDVKPEEYGISKTESYRYINPSRI